mmetsp:Transcript_55605/g.148964  ORF Transcript_55605/g.148964 Transcript_55605/m.148964 type:complete len:221 (-) Transcript_55605:45-707(-)
MVPLRLHHHCDGVAFRWRGEHSPNRQVCARLQGHPPPPHPQDPDPLRAAQRLHPLGDVHDGLPDQPAGGIHLGHQPLCGLWLVGSWDPRRGLQRQVDGQRDEGRRPDGLRLPHVAALGAHAVHAGFHGGSSNQRMGACLHDPRLDDGARRLLLVLGQHQLAHDAAEATPGGAAQGGRAHQALPHGAQCVSGARQPHPVLLPREPKVHKAEAIGGAGREGV